MSVNEVQQGAPLCVSEATHNSSSRKSGAIQSVSRQHMEVTHNKLTEVTVTYLFQDSIIWTIHTELSDLVVVCHDEKRLLSWKRNINIILGQEIDTSQKVEKSTCLTWQRLAYMRTALQSFVPVNTKAFVGAVCIDTTLATGKAGGAFIDVYACFPIILQVEARPAFTLRTETQWKARLIDTFLTVFQNVIVPLPTSMWWPLSLIFSGMSDLVSAC